MRRALGLWLTLVLLLGLIGGAGAEMRAPDYVLEGYDGDSANHDWVSNLFFERMQEETGISFEFRQYTDENQWTERKKGILAGEDLPDVLFKAGLTESETRAMAEAGVLIDLKPYLAEYAPDLWAILQEHPDDLDAITLADGSIRALPAINELPSNNLMWINQTWVNNLRLETPTTAEELTEALRAFKTGDPNRNGRADEVPLSVLGMWDLRFLGHAFGIVENDYYLHVEDGRVVSGLTSDQNRAFLSWLHQLWEEELLSHSSFSTVDSLRQITDSNAAITYGMFLSTSPLSVVPTDAMGQYTALDPLKYEGEQHYRELIGALTRGTFALTRACKEPEKMVAWVNRLYTLEGSLLLQVGKEGVEYFWNEEGTWEWMDDLTTVANEILPNATLSDGGTAPGIVAKDFQTKYADSATGSLIDAMIREQDFAVLPYPLVNLTEADAAAIAKLQAEIAPYAEKKMAEFVTGDTELNDAAWVEFTAEIERRGMNEMIEIWQKYVK